MDKLRRPGNEQRPWSCWLIIYAAIDAPLLSQNSPNTPHHPSPPAPKVPPTPCTVPPISSSLRWHCWHAFGVCRLFGFSFGFGLTIFKPKEEVSVRTLLSRLVSFFI
ncbi:hypothetical protein ACLKA6_003446 [Drosophila palustris]